MDPIPGVQNGTDSAEKSSDIFFRADIPIPSVPSSQTPTSWESIIDGSLIVLNVRHSWFPHQLGQIHIELDEHNDERRYRVASIPSDLRDEDGRIYRQIPDNIALSLAKSLVLKQQIG